MTKSSTKRVKSKRNLGLIITVCVLGALLTIMSVLFALSLRNNYNTSLNLEDIYQKNFYDLVDNINNTETKLSKTISAKDSSYQAKLLEEVSKNATLAQVNLNNLPYSINGLDKTVTFINQTSGYAETLSKKLKRGEKLTSDEITTLENIYDSIVSIKESLNKMSKDMWNGYSIVKTSVKLDGDYNVFTNKLSSIKSNDVEYPTMIYDGPFSDSQVKKEVKGLKGAEVSEAEAKDKILELFSDYNADMVEFVTKTNGRFKTFDFTLKNKDGKEMGYAQITQTGGYLLTLSSYNDKNAENLSIENAEAVALDFTKKNKIENPKVVWSDIVGGNAFINIAPVQNDVILYPDLVKLKIDLSNGTILGYEATSYYTNHTARPIPKATFNKQEAKKNIGANFIIQEDRLALIPLDYNQEILCFEFVCSYGGDDYYFYINAITGAEENILKVIKTDDGNLLM